LQKFKLNIANTIINRENTSISTMSTDQLLDLFSYEGNAKKGAKSNDGDGGTDLMGNVDKKKPGKLKSVLDSLEELWDESQYEEYSLESFMGQLNK
jgi:TATA-binding protein-associated factor